MAQSFGQRLASWFGSPRSQEAEPAVGSARLIVGLGNPGRQYARTRHNIGFEVVERLAQELGCCPAVEFDRLARQKFDGLVHECQLNTTTGMLRMLMLKPGTYMNLSGEAVQKAARFYKLAPEQTLVVLDDLALPAGKLRLRASGSDGGHNGLRDIQRALGTDQYPRLRVGIDAPPPGFAGKDYVLGRFTQEQRAKIDVALPRAVECCLVWSKEGIEAAMNRFNRDS